MADTEMELSALKTLSNLDDLQKQARLNTIEMRNLRRYVDDLTPERLKVEIQEKIDSTEDPQERQKQEIFLGNLNDEQISLSIYKDYVNNVEEKIQKRQRRSGFLIKRRNEVISAQDKKKKEEAQQRKENIPKQIWGENLEKRRKELLTTLAQYHQDIELSIKSFGEDHAIQKTMLNGLKRNTSACIELLSRVPLRFREDL